MKNKRDKKFPTFDSAPTELRKRREEEEEGKRGC